LWIRGWGVRRVARKEREKWERQNGIATKGKRLVPKTKVLNTRCVDWIN
jgi:hypothetical protein